MEQLELWKARITECKNSDLSIKQWCTQHNLKDPTYHYWRKKIALIELEQEDHVKAFAEIPLPKFRPEVVTDESARLSITWKQCEVTISSIEEAKLAATFFHQLANLC